MSYKNKISRVDLQASCAATVLVVISCTILFLLGYHTTYQDMLKGLYDRVYAIHSYLEEKLETESFSLINTKEDMYADSYQKGKELLTNAKESSGVRYLYTAKRRQTGDYVYLIDGLPQDSEDFRYPGDLIEPEIIPELEQALKGNTVLPKKIMDTSWGYIFVCYYPIHKNGEIVGAVGIEFDAEHQYKTFRTLRLTFPGIIVLFCLLSFALSFLLFRRISNPMGRDLSTTDFLTGLKNRNAFEVAVKNLDAKGDKEKNGFLSVDFDGLKTINDTLGHAMGDEYLKTGSAVIAKTTQAPDVLYRTGGDEFIVLMRGRTYAQAQILRDKIEKAVRLHNETAQLKISFSAGMAMFSQEQDKNLFDTLKRADLEMYEEKRRKKEQDSC